MHIPVPIMKAASKAGCWLVKHGPKIMTVAGGAMAVGGAVMACEATLHADEVLDRHNQKMARIKAAKALSDENEGIEGAEVYTDAQMKKDKAIVWAETGIEFAKLYAPAVTVGLSGVALMHGAFHIVENRHANTLAALTALDQAYNELLAKNPDQAALGSLPVDGEGKIVHVKSLPDTPFEEYADDEAHQLALSSYIPVENFGILEEDPFTIIFNSDNDDWYAGGNNFLLNANQIDTTFRALEMRLESYARPIIWMNDIRRAFGQNECAIGWSHGYNAFKGDTIEYDIFPFVYDYEDGMLVGMSSVDGATNEERIEILRNIELSEGPDSYCVVISLRSSNSPTKKPRFIRNEVFGK